MINSEKWIKTINNQKEFEQTKNSIDSQIWIKTIPKNDKQIWINTIPKKNSHSIFSKYFFITSFFVIGLILVTIVKNQTRNLEKELNNLKTSVDKLQLEIHYAVLDHEVITSPENIYNLKNKYLDINLLSYKKSQIKNLEEIYKEKSITKKNGYKEDIKKHLSKKIIEKKNQLKNIQKIYSKPEELPLYIKESISNKIDNTKKNIEQTYSEPKKIITSARAQRWAAIQVVKAFLGIPVVPGK